MKKSFKWVGKKGRERNHSNVFEIDWDGDEPSLLVNAEYRLFI